MKRPLLFQARQVVARTEPRTETHWQFHRGRLETTWRLAGA